MRRISSIRRVFSCSLLIAVPLLVCRASMAGAQDRDGTIVGSVTDAAHAVLQGARIEIQPRGIVSVSDQQGLFTFSHLPAGEYTITFSYVGLLPLTKPVTVSSGQVIRLEAVLEVAGVSEEITVNAARPRGEAQALNRQRTADNIVQVLPAEVIVSLPNTNIADAVGRLPSVSLERDEGEGKYVQIRGTDPRLSNVTINGVNVPPPEGGVRNVKLDVIPSDLVASIEVNKTLSANQDGDAIGGSINLVTKTAPDEPYVAVSAMGGYTNIVGGRALDQLTATVASRFGPEKRTGVLLGGSFDWNGRGINDIEPSPGTNDFGNGPVPVVASVDIREYVYRRARSGLTGSLDHRFGAGSVAFVRGLFSHFNNYGSTWFYTPNAGNFITPSLTDDTGAMTFRAYDREVNQQIFSVDGGAKHNLGSMLLDYDISVADSRQQGNFPTANFNGPDRVAFGIDTNNPFLPRFSALNGVDIHDPSTYTLATWQGAAKDPTSQRNVAGTVSLTHAYLSGSHPGMIEIGGKVRDARKTRTVNDQYYDATGAPALTMSAIMGGPTDSGYYFGQYNVGPLTSIGKMMSFLAANPSALALNVDSTHQRDDPNNYHTTERVYAAYAMNTLDLVSSHLQTGVRIETTQSSYTGYHVTLDAAGHYLSTVPVDGKQTYTNVLPSVQYRYAIDGNTNVRAVYGMGIARPNFGDLPPYILEQDRRHAIGVGNPALKPTRANNMDLLFEHFLDPLGVIDVGAFYKALRNPIYPGVQTTVASGTYAGFTQSQPINGPSAHVGGAEMTWQQRFSFLPQPLSGIGLTANYSYTTSMARVPGRLDNPALLRQAPNNWNLDGTYDKGAFSGRIGLTHNDAYIYSYNFRPGADGGIKGPNGDVYLYPHTQLDAQVSLGVTRQLQVVVALLNLNNEVFGFYQGSPQYPIQREFYNRTFSVGLRLRR
jgi:TonB-dependent receptor